MSASSAPPPAATNALDAADSSRAGWIASSGARGAAGDEGRRSQPGRRGAPSSRSIATMRAARSGCAPVSCSSDDGMGEQDARHGGADTVPRDASRWTPTSRSSAPAPPASTPRSPPRREGARVALVSATPLAQTASYWAQGGIAAALAVDDSPEEHLRRHRGRRPRPHPPQRRRGARRRRRRARAPTSRRSASASTPTATATLSLGLEGGHSRAPRRPRRRQRHRAARRARALRARRRRPAHRPCSRARAPPTCGCTRAAASAC